MPDHAIAAADFPRRVHTAPTATATALRWLPLGIMLASILVTLGFWKLLPSEYRVNEGTDYVNFYEPLGRSLAAGHGLTLNDQPNVSHPPGYPFILAASFKLAEVLRLDSELVLAVFAVLCMALVTVMVFHLTKRIWGTTPAILAAMLWMTYPFALWLTKQPNSELPFMVVFYLGVLLLFHAVQHRVNGLAIYTACGFLFGLAMLIRPFAIGLGATMALVVWLFRSDLRKSARLLLIVALLMGNAAAILPWEYWAFARTGRIVLLGTGGVGGVRDGLTFGAERKNYREGNNYSADLQVVMSDFNVKLRDANNLKEVGGVIAAEAAIHPLGVTKLFLLKIARSWYGTDSLRNEGWILLLQLLYAVLLVWCLQKIWRQSARARGLTLATLIVVAYFWAMSVVGTSLLRYMVPVTGLIFVLMAGAFKSPAPRLDPKGENGPALIA